MVVNVMAEILFFLVLSFARPRPRPRPRPRLYALPQYNELALDGQSWKTSLSARTLST
jgi:hypothetical protein